MKRTSTRKRGFTLVELLVVIGIIAVLASIISVATPDAGLKVRAAQRIAGGMVKAARGQAVLKGRTARLIIYNEKPGLGGEDQKYLRYFGIVYFDDSNPDPARHGWVAINEGSYIPHGVFFSEKFSTRGGGQEGARPDTMRIPFPRNRPVAEGEEGSAEWYFYQFEKNGLTTENAGARLVVAAGNFANADGDVDLSDDTLGGFVLHRQGSITYAEDPQDLKAQQ